MSHYKSNHRGHNPRNFNGSGPPRNQQRNNGGNYHNNSGGGRNNQGSPPWRGQPRGGGGQRGGRRNDHRQGSHSNQRHAQGGGSWEYYSHLDRLHGHLAAPASGGGDDDCFGDDEFGVSTRPACAHQHQSRGGFPPPGAPPIQASGPPNGPARLFVQCPWHTALMPDVDGEGDVVMCECHGNSVPQCFLRAYGRLTQELQAVRGMMRLCESYQAVMSGRTS